MRVAIFGGTGRSGRILIAKALAHGHEVVALARDPSKLDPIPSLIVTKGDALVFADVARTIEGTTAVITALGGADLNFRTQQRTSSWRCRPQM